VKSLWQPKIMLLINKLYSDLVSIRFSTERILGGQHSRRNENTGKDNVPKVVVVAEPVTENSEPLFGLERDQKTAKD
jgi:hypothetical protein